MSVKNETTIRITIADILDFLKIILLTANKGINGENTENSLRSDSIFKGLE